MSELVDKTADMLMAQLARLDKMTIAAGEEMGESVEKLKAECERARAVNETVKNIVSLGQMHMQAEALQMAAPERQFEPGRMFSAGHGVERDRAQLPMARATAWGEDSTTRINELGEFVDEDGN